MSGEADDFRWQIVLQIAASGTLIAPLVER
jgi:hypothetical protein